jgi:hypothetical protein
MRLILTQQLLKGEVEDGSGKTDYGHIARPGLPGIGAYFHSAPSATEERGNSATPPQD